MTDEIYRECAERTKETGRIHLPNQRCEIYGAPRIENSKLVISYTQAPGICMDRPFDTSQESSLIRIAEAIEFRHLGRNSSHVTLLPRIISEIPDSIDSLCNPKFL